MPLNTGGSAIGPEIERVCLDNEWVITTWSAIHLRSKLKELYWKADKNVVKAMTFWEDTLRYIYLPRLKTREVLEQAIKTGAGSKEFFGTALGERDGKFEGFKFGDATVQLDDTLLLIEIERAKQVEAAQNVRLPTAISPTEQTAYPATAKPPVNTVNTPKSGGLTVDPPLPIRPDPVPVSQKPRHFIGTVDISAATAKMRLRDIADEIIAVLASDPNAEINITVEIQAEFEQGANDHTKRAVSENAKSLGFKHAEWE